MLHGSQKQELLNAVPCIRSAEELLVQAGRDSSDAETLKNINGEYGQLDAFLSRVLHCIAIADDEGFAESAAALTTQAATLQAMKDSYQAMAAGVNTAAQIVGCLTEALAFLAKL